MKINQDCMRVVMLYLENNLGLHSRIADLDLTEVELLQSFSCEDVIYSVRQLYKSGLLEADVHNRIRNGICITVTDITPKGHEFCDYVRNESDWRKAKPKIEGLSSVNTIMSILANLFKIATTFIS